jgi:hypothetical protein
MKSILVLLSVICLSILVVSGDSQGDEEIQVLCHPAPCDPADSTIPRTDSGHGLGLIEPTDEEKKEIGTDPELEEFYKTFETTTEKKE